MVQTFNRQIFAKSSLLLALAAALLTAGYAQADIYKWKDKGGVTRYSDVPPNDNTPYTTFKSKNLSSGSALGPASSDDKKVESSKLLDIGKTKSADQKATQSALRQKACDNAKDNLDRLKTGGIIYKENAKGEREYLDDTVIKAEREKAEKEVSATCNPA